MKGFPRRGSDCGLVHSEPLRRAASMKGFPRRGSDGLWLWLMWTVTVASMKGFPRRGSDAGPALGDTDEPVPQ